MKNGCRAVFIDRDGTINPDVGYMHRVSDFRFIPGVKKGIKILNERGFKIIVVTNQSAIARGILTHEKLLRIHNKMKETLKRYGAEIDGIFYCPHHPDDMCSCRKPGTLLFKRAIKEHKINVDESYMIGDKIIDVAASKKVGLKAILIPERNKEEKSSSELAHSVVRPDFICKTFIEAVNWILNEDSRSANEE